MADPSRRQRARERRGGRSGCLGSWSGRPGSSRYSPRARARIASCRRTPRTLPTRLSGLLLSPARRWDAGWFLAIAQGGYDAPEPRTAFFPLYPLLIRIVGEPIDALGLAGAYPFELAGVLISTGGADRRALPAAPPHRSGAWARGRRQRGPAARAVPDGVLLLGDLLGIAVPRADARVRLRRPARLVVARRAGGRAGIRHARAGRAGARAAGDDAAALPAEPAPGGCPCSWFRLGWSPSWSTCGRPRATGSRPPSRRTSRSGCASSRGRSPRSGAVPTRPPTRW